jgi:hypothetical protein
MRRAELEAFGEHWRMTRRRKYRKHGCCAIHITKTSRSINLTNLNLNRGQVCDYNHKCWPRKLIAA